MHKRRSSWKVSGWRKTQTVSLVHVQLHQARLIKFIKFTILHSDRQPARAAE